MERPTTEQIIEQMKNVSAEMDRLRLAVRDLGEAFSDFQEKLGEAESKFGMFRSLYWKTKEMVDRWINPPDIPQINDGTIQPGNDDRETSMKGD